VRRASSFAASCARAGSTGKLTINNAYSGTAVGATSDGVIAAGSWYHVAATRDGSNNWAIYSNGAVVASGNNSTAIQASTSPLSIGVSDGNGSKSFPFQGSIDEVAVYNTALSSSRISAHYLAAARG
jgi:Concanavalin A-like lectin/glucanases superfamily